VGAMFKSHCKDTYPLAWKPKEDSESRSRAYATVRIPPEKPQIKTKTTQNPPFFKTLVRPPMDNRGGIHPIGGLMR